MALFPQTSRALVSVTQRIFFARETLANCAFPTEFCRGDAQKEMPRLAPRGIVARPSAVRQLVEYIVIESLGDEYRFYIRVDEHPSILFIVRRGDDDASYDVRRLAPRHNLDIPRPFCDNCTGPRIARVFESQMVDEFRR